MVFITEADTPLLVIRLLGSSNTVNAVEWFVAEMPNSVVNETPSPRPRVFMWHLEGVYLKLFA